MDNFESTNLVDDFNAIPNFDTVDNAGPELIFEEFVEYDPAGPFAGLPGNLIAMEDHIAPHGDHYDFAALPGVGNWNNLDCLRFSTPNPNVLPYGGASTGSTFVNFPSPNTEHGNQDQYQQSYFNNAHHSLQLINHNFLPGPVKVPTQQEFSQGRFDGSDAVDRPLLQGLMDTNHSQATLLVSIFFLD